VGVTATDRAEVRWEQVVRLKPEVGDLGFLVAAVAKCVRGSQGNVDLAIGEKTGDNFEH